MNIVLHKMIVTEHSEGVAVTLQYAAPGTEPDETQDGLTFRVTFGADDSNLRLPELKLTALRALRTLIGREIQDFEHNPSRKP